MVCKAGGKVELGNLNRHAQDRHFGKTMFVSLTNGWVVLCNSPITIQHYKCVFFNNLGQEVDIQNAKTEWAHYKLNLTALNQLVDIMIFKEEASLIRAIEIYRNYLEINGRL